MLRPLLSLVAVALATQGCSGFGATSSGGAATPAASPEGDGRADAPEIPVALAMDDDYVVRIVAGSVTCSGTLIDEDLVLTAHHCIAERNQYGDILSRDVEPKEVQVELGGDYLPWGEVSVKAMVAPPCGHSAGVGDIAILVLERKLIGVATATPRLDSPPKLGDAIRPIGFGRCASTDDGVRRRRRTGGAVSRVRPARFNLDASICPGDSGGPALTPAGEVVGVISASVMDDDAGTAGRTEFARLDTFRAVFANAKALAEGTNVAELPPIDSCHPKAAKL